MIRNPTVQEFVTRLQIEEKYFSNKYFEAFRSPVPIKRNPTLKRKGFEISTIESQQTSHLDIPSQELKIQKMEIVCSTSSSQKILINLNKKCIQIPWIKWKKNSCRIDTFATLAYHIFYYDYSESIFPNVTGPKLPGELHPLGVLLTGIEEATNLQSLQKVIDNYGVYRAQNLKEKPGKGGDIFSLFGELRNLSHFQWVFSITEVCECGQNSRIANSDPLITISTSSLIEVFGSCSEAIKLSLSDYYGTCFKDNKQTKIQKTIKKIPNYYCCNLDYAENLQKGLIEKSLLPKIIIEEYFAFEDMTFELSSIIYFQALHYTLHVKGVSHPIFFPNRDYRWFYHDGVRDSMQSGSWGKGFLFENHPNFQIDLSGQDLKPYILVYKILCNKV